MEYRQLGRSELEVSVIGFGGFAIGGRWWGDPDDQAAIAAVRRALDLGINLFDTAPVYGSGHSEELLARALENQRKEVVIATKFGLFGERRDAIQVDNSPARLRRDVESSLRRLRTDTIDLLQIHWPEEKTPIEDTVRAMLLLQKEGKVRYLGACNYDPPRMERALSAGRLDSLQSPYHLLRRGVEKEDLPLCRQQEIGFLAYEPLCRGLLTGKFTGEETFDDGSFDLRATDPRFRGQRFRDNVQLVRRLERIAGGLGCSVAQLAVAWTLAHPAVTSALCGAKRPEQIQECAAAASYKLGGTELAAIDAVVPEELRDQKN